MLSGRVGVDVERNLLLLNGEEELWLHVPALPASSLPGACLVPSANWLSWSSWQKAAPFLLL